MYASFRFLKGFMVMLTRVPRLLLCLGVACAVPVFTVVAADPPKAAGKGVPKAAAKPDEHAHADVGPHKGSLIELGEEEYHGEIVFDDKNDTVTIYLLDDHAKESVPCDAKEVAINLKHDGKGVAFKLKAQPQKADPMGKSSRFSIKSHDLMHALEEKDAGPMLRSAIKGKTYSGKINAHDHDHEHEADKKAEKK
jgi:hypothetical protein